MANDKDKGSTYTITPFSGTPGQDWEDFEDELYNALALKTDERGSSLADTLEGNDEGGAHGAQFPAGADGQKALRLRNKRLKDLYAFIAHHQEDKEVRSYLRLAHFQDPLPAMQYLRDTYRKNIDTITLRQMTKDFDDFDLLHEIGVNENSVPLACKKLRHMNSRRPAAHRFDETRLTEKLLEMLFQTSKHFSESATVEYNAPAGSRKFEHPAGHARAGQRDFRACEAHFHALWSSAVRSRMPGFHTRAPTAKPSAPTRNTLESGLVLSEARSGALEAGSQDTYVRRSGSPTKTLGDLACAGDELAARRGTMTTTDWGMLNESELACVVADEPHDEFDVAYVFDGDDTGSVELLCNNCRGLGHIAKFCPSAKKFRSHEYAIAANKNALDKKNNNVAKRPPGRGQRPPFRAQPPAPACDARDPCNCAPIHTHTRPACPPSEHPACARNHCLICTLSTLFTYALTGHTRSTVIFGNLFESMLNKLAGRAEAG